MKPGAKLFSLLRDVALPGYTVIDPVLGIAQACEQVLPAVFILSWPDGTPCLYAEMFLLDKSYRLTTRRNDGGSLKVAATDLSHLLRFCWQYEHNLWELGDNELREMIAWLQQPRSINNPTAPQRNRNTINRVIAQVIEFLLWLQRTIMPERQIVGTREQRPQITCVETTGRRYGQPWAGRLAFTFRLTADSPDPKGPISRELRQQLWEGVVRMAGAATENAHYMARFPSRAAWLAERDYLRARRELMLSLLDATGCRPGELARLSLAKNLACVATGKIILTTLKRRRAEDPERIIPLARVVCVRLELFIRKYRAALVTALQQRNRDVVANDAVFITCRTGTPMLEVALTKDFQRITRCAGITQRTCMSMFRHRFITNMVALHLNAFVRESPGKDRQYLIEADYRSILKRVAVFTGHGSVDSLFVYIDWAWEELGAFDRVAEGHALTSAIDESLQRLSILASELEREPPLTAEAAINVVSAELDTIRVRVRDAGKRT